jgi:hypothetical protein
MNIEALNQGYTLMKEQLNDLQGDFKLQTTEENPHYLIVLSSMYNLDLELQCSFLQLFHLF